MPKKPAPPKKPACPKDDKPGKVPICPHYRAEPKKTKKDKK